MTTAAILAFALALVPAPPVEVRGDTLCPSAAEVAAILPELLPPSEATYADVAWIEVSGLHLRIELRSPRGEVLFSRRLATSGTCAELATIAAVVIASWTAERNPGISLLQPGVAAPAKPVVTPPPPALAPVEVAPVASPRRMRELDLALAVGSTANAAGFAAAARADIGIRGQRFGLRAAFVVETERSQAIESGSIAWRRYRLSSGPTFAVIRRPLLLELGAEIFAGLTTAAGRSFDVNRRSRAVAPGLASALRLATSTGRWRPWLEVGGQYWLAGQGITVSRPGLSDARAPLPSLEGRLFLGISLVF